VAAVTINYLQSLVKDDFEKVNKLIIDKIQSQVGLIDDLSHHIVESGGKRLRPLLTLLSCNAFGYKGGLHIDLSAMVEFFHTATLLHDDVIDESRLRRGKQTANEIWGSKASILVGDYLYTLSVQLIVEIQNSAILELFASTSHKITCGEVKQLVNRHNTTLSVDDYFEVIRAKTALLFAASAEIGPLLTNADDSKRQAMHDYGLHLGNAFQLADDALDYCSDVETIGKNIGDDLADGKATLPLIYAMQNCQQEPLNIIEKSLINGSLEHLDVILETIEQTKSIEYTKNLARNEVDKALTALACIEDSDYKKGLMQLAEFALSRSY
jgi:octaprenyl-diphosphate synthase